MLLAAFLAASLHVPGTAHAAGALSEKLPANLEELRGDYAAGGDVLYVGGWTLPSGPYLYRQRDAERQRLRAGTSASWVTAAGERLVFERGADGRVTGVTYTAAGGAPRRMPRVEPYEVREARVPAGEVELAGSLLVPPGGPHPAVVLVHGSGPDCGEAYLNLADSFARRGVAALAYDKRGTGGSTGVRATAGFEDLARDALAAVHWLRAQPGIAPGRVGLWGISQGGWVVPLAASLSSEPAFAITVAASGVSPGEQESWRIGNNLFYAGLGPAALDVARRGWALLHGTRDVGLLRRAAPGLWWHSLDPALDPKPVWERVRQPVLAVWGELDGLVPARESLETVRRALERGGNPKYRLRIFPRSEHNVLLAEEGFQNEPYAPWEYAPGYLEELTSFMLAAPAAPGTPAVVLPEHPARTRLGWHFARTESSAFGTVRVQLPVWLALVAAFVTVLVRGLLRLRAREAGGWTRIATGAAGTAAVAAFLVAWKDLVLETSVPGMLGWPWALLAASLLAMGALAGGTVVVVSSLRARRWVHGAASLALVAAAAAWAAYWHLLPLG